MNSYLFAWLFLNILFGVNVSLFTKYKCFKTCQKSCRSTRVCELVLPLLSVVSPSNVTWWFLNMSINWGRRIWMGLHSRLWLHWTDPSCVYRYGLHSNFTLEAMIIMIFKNPRSNQLSSVLGVWSMRAVIDFSLRLQETNEICDVLQMLPLCETSPFSPFPRCQ